MKEPSKTNLLLPLGIGAGVLVLLAGMKSKASAAPGVASLPIKTGGEDAMPLVEENVAPGQINPSPAPSYVPPVQRTADAGEDFNTEAQDEGMLDEQNESQPDSSEEANEDFSVESQAYSTGQEQGSLPRVSNQRKPDMRTEQRFMPGGKPSMRTATSAANQTTAYRPGAYNPKQARFEPSANQQVSYRPGATNQPVNVRQSPIMPAVKNNVIKATSNANGKIFPLRMGMTNAYVKEVQRRIGVPATGYFGTMTLAALRTKYNVSEVSEVLYKQIITGKAVVVQKPVVRKVQQRRVVQKSKPGSKVATNRIANRYKPKSS